MKSTISAYGGSRLPVVGEVILKASRDETKCKLNCKLVDSEDIRPILGRKACLGMNIIRYTDNDALNKPQTRSFPIYAVKDNGDKFLTKEHLCNQFPEVFSEGVGKLEGKYHMKINSEMSPVQHAPQRVPVAVRARLKEELDRMTEQEIITPVTAPTPWVSSMVVVPKPDRKLRICLDPKELNKAIQREHYPLPTIEDVATRLHGAKIFAKLDVKNGFWHIELDQESSYLTTFNTPFGRYRWKRMPFGICSVPEMFQRRMHELIGGMLNVEVIADDFVVVGYGETQEEAIRNHDDHLVAFLKLCKNRGLKLNTEKIRLRQRGVSFIGHVATDTGLRVDPAKVKAIVEMPAPTNKSGVQRLLGLAQYLSKFLPHLSDLTKPLRELTQKEVEWCWEEAQENAFRQLKEAVTRTPVLRYYNVKEPVTIQCDASQMGLGAALLQNGQPVAYASRALSSAETRYAQIEKELLAVVFACERFETYIYGRDVVHVDSDHKPLETIVLKLLHAAPQRLQRMLLRLQKYNLELRYKKGCDMFLADTLSRAYLPEVNSSEVTQELEGVDHKLLLPVSEARWQQIEHASADDPVLQELRLMTQQGWPSNRSDVPPCLLPYFDIRDELVVQAMIVFKGHQLVVLAALRKEMMAATHNSHIRIEACIRRARESLYWPRMTVELKEYIQHCDVCPAHRNEQGKEPLAQHDFAARPWSKVTADLCQLEGRTLLVISDYYSNFIEVARVTAITARSIIKELKAVFERFGIPDILVADNGPQFASSEFSVFACTWEFKHVTSSPTYAQSNGKAENAVKTVKHLFKKCKDSGQSEYLALLDWRNTPTAGIGTSPAQRLMGRRCKTLLPIAGKLLQPRYDTEGEARALLGAKQRQQFHYNRHTKPVEEISPGETVRVKLPGKERWTKGTCAEALDHRSYLVKVGDTQYRQNRRHLLKMSEPSTPEQGEDINPTPAASEENNPEKEDPPTTELRRSGRARQAPAWHKDYEIKA